MSNHKKIDGASMTNEKCIWTYIHIFICIYTHTHTHTSWLVLYNALYFKKMQERFRKMWVKLIQYFI